MVRLCHYRCLRPVLRLVVALVGTMIRETEDIADSKRIEVARAVYMMLRKHPVVLAAYDPDPELGLCDMDLRFVALVVADRHTPIQSE